MTDYRGNSNKSKEPKDERAPIEKVVTGEVKTRKKPLGERMKDVFLGGDAQTVARYVGAEVLLPALRNLLVDATTKGIERMVYGESASPRRVPDYRPRTTYNSPINRGYTPDPRYGGRANLPDQPTYSTNRSSNELILNSRSESELVLESLQDIIDKYDVASVADLYQLVGLPTAYTDNKWGWATLRGSEIRQVREGYLLDLPHPEPL
jgi:hypothetical protein